MGRSNQSFLKRQKEQKRKEKAEMKRAVRQSRGENPRPADDWNILMGPDGPVEGQGAPPEAGDEAAPSED